MNKPSTSLRTRTDSIQLNKANEIFIDNKQQQNTNTMSTCSSLPISTPPRTQANTILEDFEQSFNRLFTSSLSYKKQKIDEIFHLSKMISPKKVQGERKVNSYYLNTDVMNHSSNTKIIIPLVQLPLPLFKIENTDHLLGKKTMKTSSKGPRKNSQNEIDNDENILFNEIEKDINKEMEKDKENEGITKAQEQETNKDKSIETDYDHQPSLLSSNQSNVYNVNITNVNINYSNSTPNKNIIKEIKDLLLEKGLKYDSTHQKDSKDLKFSIGDYGYLIRQDQKHAKFLCFVRTFNHSNRDKDIVITNECDIIKELRNLKENLKKAVRKV